MTRILLIGADGMLGSALAHVLCREAAGAHEATLLTRSEFDIASGRWAELPVRGHDWVLNAAGLINRRDAPTDQLWTVNAVFPHALAALCVEHGARLVHVSTDCVFDGLHGPFNEAAAASAVDAYGRSKSMGEPPSAMTLRTSIVGPEQRRFHNLLCWALRQDRIDGFRNHRWNGVTTLALARSIAAMIRDGVHQPGVHHIHADDTTKHALLGLICARFGHSANLHEMDAPCPRDTRLRTRHPDFLAALRLPPLAEQIAELATLSTSLGRWRGA